jgi:hypothetical protein
MKHCWMPGVEPFFNVRERLELFVPLYLLETNISATLSGSQVPLLNDRAIQPFSLPSLHIKIENRKKSKNLSIEQLSFSILGQEPLTLCALIVAIFTLALFSECRRNRLADEPKATIRRKCLVSHSAL